MFNFHYQCSQCGREYEITSEMMLCPECSQAQKPDEPLRGILEVVIDGHFHHQPKMSDLLPVAADYFPNIPVGNTPLWKPANLNQELGFPDLFIKDDTHNLTGSLKDRASYLVAAFAKRENVKAITLASTGNAASSMAGIGAAAGLDITIFLPETAPKAKLVQSLQYGARVIPVAGTYDNAFDLSLEYSHKYKILSRNTAYNPLTIEGKKTVSLEIYHQLERVPDYLFVPTGDGVILGGVYKGFRDLMQLGIIDRIPTVIAVQAEGSNAIARAFESGSFTAIDAHTVADSISVGIPRNGYYALKQLKQYNGKCVTVTDEAILVAQKELSANAGLFAEPAAAASYAGFLKMKDEIENDATVVLLVTGNGLKDIDSAMTTIEFPSRSITSLEELD
ncbi:threonine synthase [bacterium]|nr:threonine synthase [bacterium]MBU1063928.1 threonine synthase [bacterium]MBU1633671.1 threonine synthase [bacterium]MBU1873582.1 threonine synthase [bacterium]